MINKAFEMVSNKVFKALEGSDFKKHNVASSSENELVSLYIGKDLAYNIVYNKENMQLSLSRCSVTENEPDNDWKTISKWMFDPERDSLKDAENIGNDFAETVGKPSLSAQRIQKRKKKGDDGNADPVFFYKRLVSVLPELKDEIKEEEQNEKGFRALTFARENVVDKLHVIIKENNKSKVKKLGEILSNQYIYGDLDVRSIITIVILNSLDSGEEEILSEYLSNDLKKAWSFAKKIKGKKIKPEKEKSSNKRGFLAQTLKEN